MTGRHGVMVATALVLGGCAAGDEDVGSERLALSSPLDRYQWRASHNTYEAAHTPPGKDVTWHFTQDTTGTPPNPVAIKHIEIDIRDTVTGGRPSGWADTLSGNWWVAHDAAGPVTVHCGTVGRFTDCLNFIKTYHNNNAGHDFITVWVDKKDDWEGYDASTAVRSPWQFDNQIASRFTEDTLYTPHDVLGDGQGSVRDIVMADGWRSPDELAGKVMFILTSDATIAGSERLERYVEHRLANAKAFVATPGSSQSQVVDGPAYFSASNAEWVAIYNFEWSSGSFDGNCNSSSCQWLFEATNLHFLTRTWDLDDHPEYLAAGTAGATFRPVNCPWMAIANDDRYDCGL